MSSAWQRPVHISKACWIRKLFSSWVEINDRGRIFGLIWPFGTNQWPRHQDSLVLTSSRTVKIIGRGAAYGRRWGDVLPSWGDANWPPFPPCFVSVRGNCCPVGSSRKWALSPPPHFLNRGLDTWAQDVLDSIIIEKLSERHPAGPTVRLGGAAVGSRGRAFPRGLVLVLLNTKLS